MTLTNLHLKNFKKYTDFCIEFEEGLIGIIGKNGSGKSTIFEAILFALYGEFKSRGNRELVRNSFATIKDVVVVELKFEFNGVDYRVVRELRGKALNVNAKLFKKEELISSSATEVTKSVVALTKMSKDAFINTLFASQKELTTLSTLSKEDRRKMIRKLLGLGKIDFIEKELVEKSRELKRDINAFDEVLLSGEEVKHKEEQIRKNETTKKSDEKELKKETIELNKLRVKELDVKVELDKFIKIKEQKQRIFSEIELQKSSIDNHKKNQIKLNIELKKLDEKAKELQKLSHVKSDYNALHVRVQEQIKLKEHSIKKDGILKAQVRVKEQYIKAKSDITLLEKECEPFELLSQELEKLSLDMRDNQEKLKSALSLEKVVLANIAGEESLIKTTNSKIDKIQTLGRESECPTCTRPLLEEYDNVMSELHKSITDIYQTKIETLHVELQIVQNSRDELEKLEKLQKKKHQDIFGKINIIKSKKDDLSKAQNHFIEVESSSLENKKELQELEQFSYDKALHVELESNYKELTKTYNISLSLETELKRVPHVEQELKDVEKHIASLTSTCSDKEKEHKAIKYDELKHNAKSVESDELVKLREAKSTQESDIKVAIAKLDGEIKIVQNSLDNNNKQLKKVQTKKDDLLDYLKIKESLTAFKIKLNAKIAPRISEIASTMYSQITKGKYQHIEVSNDFDFFIYDDGKKYPIERFSGGEIDLANLVLRIAISKTITELNGATSIGFLAFDEVFGSQDESRRMEILEAFHTIKEQYRQIFLISHEVEIKEMFERVVEV